LKILRPLLAYQLKDRGKRGDRSMENLHQFYHRFLDDLESHRDKYEKLAHLAKAHGDRETYNKVRIQMGMLRMSEALFIKNYAKDFGLLPKRSRKAVSVVKTSWPETAPDQEISDPAIRPFFRFGKLTKIPASRQKKLKILGLIAEQFAKDRSYVEKEVNDKITEIHEDYCVWRRMLVDEGYMRRCDGVYRAV
jgi:hypothetical protein